jgi:hypothetical protein
LCQFIHWPAAGAARFFAKAHEISALSKFNIAAHLAPVQKFHSALQKCGNAFARNSSILAS